MKIMKSSQMLISISFGIIITIAFVMICFGEVSAQSNNSGTLELTQHGWSLRVNYDISGATITKVGEDNLDTTNYLSNERTLDGFLESDHLRISGAAIVEQNSWPASTLEVKIVDDSSGTVLKTYTDKLDSGDGKMDYDLEVPVSKSGNYDFYITLYWHANYLHIVQVSGTLSPASPTQGQPNENQNPTSTPPCDRLQLDLEEGTGPVAVAKVVDACEHKPLKDANLEIRIFHTYDARLNKWINGDYVDRPQMLTNENGEAIIPVSGNPGDIYRVDAYASKEGWDMSDRSIHITIGDNTNERYPQLGNRISINEIGQYFGEWTRREGTDTFDAVWNDGQVTDIIEIQSVEGNRVTLYRQGNGGYYYGTINDDGTITGTASWYQPGWTWSGTIED
jgi:hypothetical protein